MNKTLTISAKVIQAIYTLLIIVFISFVVYKFEFQPIVTPQSTIPELSVGQMQSVMKEIEKRTVIEDSIPKDIPNVTYGKEEPFQ